MPSRATATISAILVDDEQLASEELAYLLREFPDVEIVATASNGLEAVQLIEDLEPDLVFLDVQMPGLDGMGVIRKLREREVPLPHFVMATAFDQYAVEAFRLEALDYVLKPIEKDRLTIAVERARKFIGERARTAPAEPLPSKPAFATHQAAGPEQPAEFHR
jgi:two-component system LytT family response regulator/two-component system response regulator LytT